MTTPAVVARNGKPRCCRRVPYTNHPDKEAAEKLTGHGTAKVANTSTNIPMAGSLGLRIMMMEIESLFGSLLLQTLERVPALCFICAACFELFDS